jgi:hypothetical protein
MLALVVAVTAKAQVYTPPKPPPKSLKADVAAGAKQKEAIIDAVFKALGPAFRAQLRAGRQIELPGVGVFRIVRVSAYKDMVGGRPVVIPARSYIEYIPDGDATDAANAPGATPARNVEGYEFRVNPNAAPGLKTEGTRSSGIRTR